MLLEECRPKFPIDHLGGDGCGGQFMVGILDSGRSHW